MSCGAVSHAVMSHRAMPFAVVSHSHVLYRMDLHGNIPTISVLHSCERASHTYTVVTCITVTHKAVPECPQPSPHSPVGGNNLVPLAMVYWYRHFLISGHVPHSVCGFHFCSFFKTLFTEQKEAVLAGAQEK